MVIKSLGTNCTLLEFKNPSPELFAYLASLRIYLLQEIKCDSIVQSYNSLAIYNSCNFSPYIITDYQPPEQFKVSQYTFRLKPGLDIANLAIIKNITQKQLIEIFTQVEYTVAAIGFTTNFPYLWGLPEILHTPRRSSPRLQVPTGSVGIGGQQTGIYPNQSPGGWNLIGTVNPYNCNRLNVGDKVTFHV